MGTKRAFVLSGGSIKGAFQAGAIAEVLEAGFAPDAIYGTSVGSLNGGFLAERAGRAVLQGEEPDWPAIGRELEAFWLERITSSSKIAKKRPLVGLFWSILRHRFAGLVDTAPLRELVEEVMKAENLRHTPVAFGACAINVATGEEVYATPDYSGILEYIIASTAIPVEMPTSMIGKAPYVDGGIREVAPLKRAIEWGAEEIVTIVCQPQDLQGANLDVGRLFALVSRLLDIVVNELVNNDLRRFEKVNEWVQEYEAFRDKLLDTLKEAGVDQATAAAVDTQFSDLFFNRWRYIKMTEIRPKNEIVLDLLHFTPEEIGEVVQQGRNAARLALSESA